MNSEAIISYFFICDLWNSNKMQTIFSCVVVMVLLGQHPTPYIGSSLSLGGGGTARSPLCGLNKTVSHRASPSVPTKPIRHFFRENDRGTLCGWCWIIPMAWPKERGCIFLLRSYSFLLPFLPKIWLSAFPWTLWALEDASHKFLFPPRWVRASFSYLRNRFKNWYLEVNPASHRPSAVEEK